MTTQTIYPSISIEYPPIEQMFDTIIEREIKTYPCHTNRLSGIGHCLRKMYYNRTEYDKAIPVEVGLQRIFELGKKWEKAIFDTYLVQCPDLTVIQSQFPVKYKEYQLSGTPDYVLLWADNKYVVDAKSFNSNTFPQYNTWEDFYYSSTYYYRAYIYQLVGYMLLTEIGQGFLLLGDKNSMQFKKIPMELNWDIAGEVLDRAKLVNEAIAAQEPPDRVRYGKECEGCQFRHICKPPKPKETISDLTDTETEELFEDWYAAKLAKADYDKLNERVKEECYGIKTGMCGRFLVTGKENKNGTWLKAVVPAAEK